MAEPRLFVWRGLAKHIGSETSRAVEEALTDADKDYINVVIEKADHGFFCDKRDRY